MSANRAWFLAEDLLAFYGQKVLLHLRCYFANIYLINGLSYLSPRKFIADAWKNVFFSDFRPTGSLEPVKKRQHTFAFII